jgi:acetyl-CoA carboxylase biotin carboxyl carrier protein
MNQKELKELIEFLIEKDIAEFEMERGDVKVRIKRGVPAGSEAETRYVHVPAVSAVPAPEFHPPASAYSAPPSAAPPARRPAEAEEDGLHMINSPIVGTFYEAPSPGAPPFVKPGDAVDAGQILCIIEAMKLMNEIESDVAGEIVKKLVSNGQPVEYGQPLFAVRPRS